MKTKGAPLPGFPPRTLEGMRGMWSSIYCDKAALSSQLLPASSHIIGNILPLLRHGRRCLRGGPWLHSTKAATMRKLSASACQWSLLSPSWSTTRRAERNTRLVSGSLCCGFVSPSPATAGAWSLEVQSHPDWVWQLHKEIFKTTPRSG